MTVLVCSENSVPWRTTLRTRRIIRPLLIFGWISKSAQRQIESATGADNWTMPNSPEPFKAQMPVAVVWHECGWEPRVRVAMAGRGARTPLSRGEDGFVSERFGDLPAKIQPYEKLIKQRSAFSPCVYDHRVAGGHCDHCHSRRDSSAGPVRCEREGLRCARLSSR